MSELIQQHASGGKIHVIFIANFFPVNKPPLLKRIVYIIWLNWGSVHKFQDSFMLWSTESEAWRFHQQDAVNVSCCALATQQAPPALTVNSGDVSELMAHVARRANP